MQTTSTISAAALSLLLVLLATIPMAAIAEDVFQVVDAEFVDIDSTLSLNMRIDSNIPEYITIAMDQGFAVPFLFEVEIRERNRWWFDDKVVSLKQQYLLHYLPILENYIVVDRNLSQRTYFRNRDTAMYSVSRVVNYPLFSVDNLRRDADLYARVRFGIDDDELPLPLKSSSLWDNDWSIKSDWFEWSLEGLLP